MRIDDDLQYVIVCFALSLTLKLYLCSDVLCSSGWTREEVKESSWALIQFKTRSKAQDRPLSAGSDGRTDDTWFLVEELVPADYRASLLEQAQSKPKTSRRISFLRPVRKKQSKQAAPVVPDISKPLGFFNRSSETVFRPNKTGLSQFRQQATPVVRSGSPNLKTPDDSVFAGGPTKVIKLSNSIISPGISNASSLTGHEEETEAIDAPPVVVDKDEVKSIDSSQHGHTGVGYSRPSTSSGTGSGFLDMVRKTTRRNRRSLLGQAEVTAPVENQSIPSSPASTVMPGSPGFNLAEHGVSGAGRPMDNPNVRFHHYVSSLPWRLTALCTTQEWMDRMARMSSARPDLGPQRYERSTASFAGTTHSIETRVTSGHSDSSVHSASPQRTDKQALARETSHTLSEGRDSASIYDRDLPAPPEGQATERPFSSATQDAEELVAAYSQPRDSIAASQVGDGNPYDGLAEDDETVEDHQNGNSSYPLPSPSPPKSKDLPKLSVTAPDSTKGRNSPDEGSVNRRKNLRSISQGSRDAKHVSKALPSP